MDSGRREGSAPPLPQGDFRFQALLHYNTQTRTVTMMCLQLLSHYGLLELCLQNDFFK